MSGHMQTSDAIKQPPFSIGDLLGKLTGLERRLFNLLRAHEGEIVSLNDIMDGLYHDADEEPFPKIVAVMVCRIRKKLLGSPYAVETHHGKGRRLVRIAAAG